MYLDYWGFSKFPFDNVPDPDFFFLSRPHEEGLTRLLYAVERGKGCALLSGHIGCGKTTLSNVFIQKIPQENFDVGVITNPSPGPVQFLQDVLYKFGIPEVPDNKVRILQFLNNKLTGNLQENKETLLIVDEAQLLSEDTLEEIRLLLNFQLSKRFLLTIFLIGQPELVDKIEKIKQLEQRIAVKYSLRPFGLEETTDYIFFRQKKAGGTKNVLTRPAIETIYKHSGGLPRRINHLCDLAFLVAFGKKIKIINSRIIKDIIDDGTVF
ncbi:MAG: AAA family ATPase [Desulfobacterales bacterium]|nr:AAA family ATPase [Desulfobacterales bacterium]